MILSTLCGISFLNIYKLSHWYQSIRSILSACREKKEPKLIRKKLLNRILIFFAIFENLIIKENVQNTIISSQKRFSLSTNFISGANEINFYKEIILNYLNF